LPVCSSAHQAMTLADCWQHSMASLTAQFKVVSATRCIRVPRACPLQPCVSVKSRVSAVARQGCRNEGGACFLQTAPIGWLQREADLLGCFLYCFLFVGFVSCHVPPFVAG
jgi:hypothetical protein